jgi:hypothetical protein
VQLEILQRECVLPPTVVGAALCIKSIELGAPLEISVSKSEALMLMQCVCPFPHVFSRIGWMCRIVLAILVCSWHSDEHGDMSRYRDKMESWGLQYVLLGSSTLATIRHIADVGTRLKILQVPQANLSPFVLHSISTFPISDAPTTNRKYSQRPI